MTGITTVSAEHIVTVLETPGRGEFRVSVPAGQTVADAVTDLDLFNRQIFVDGSQVSPSAFKTTSLDGVVRLTAVGGTKGA